MQGINCTLINGVSVTTFDIFFDKNDLINKVIIILDYKSIRNEHEITFNFPQEESENDIDDSPGLWSYRVVPLPTQPLKLEINTVTFLNIFFLKSSVISLG